MSNETKPLTAEEVKRRAEEYGNTYRMKLGEGRAAHAGYLQGYRDCQEQTAALREELQELSAWKKSQLETFSPLLDFGQSKESGIPIGASIVQEAINALKEQKVVREELQKVTQLLSQERELHDDVVSGLKYSLDSAKEELEAVKKENADWKARNLEYSYQVAVKSCVLIQNQYDALKKKLETAVKLLEDYRYMARNDHDMAHLDMEADGFFASLQTTGQDVSPNMDAIDLIAKERKRQITVEGWTPAHDDRHDCEELAQAAACYAYPPQRAYPHRLEDWPFAAEWFKEGPNRMRELVKAGALIVAEIERLHRAQTSTSETTAKEAGSDEK